MASTGRARFVNDAGVAEIAVGAKEFECLGAASPHDHPHIYLDMGVNSHIRCPYCGTLFTHDPSLAASAARPPECVAEPDAAAAKL